MFHDIDADGFTDLLSTDTGVATFIRQFKENLGWTDTNQSIDLTDLDQVPLVGLDTRDSFTVLPASNGDPSITVSLARRQWVDVNGDGLLDVIESGDPTTQTPDDFEPLVVPVPPIAGTGYPWRIRYGQADGTVTAQADWWFAPLPHPSVDVSQGQICRLAADPIEGLDPSVIGDNVRGHHDTAVELRDLTGDGWLDLVWYGKNASQIASLPDGDELDVWIWELRPHHAIKSLDDSVTRVAFEPKLSMANHCEVIQSALNTDQVVQQVDEGWVELQLMDQGQINVDRTCVFMSGRTVRGFMDLNGDGLQDFVDTLGGEADQWRVNYNLGGLRWGEAVSWSVPAFNDWSSQMDNSPSMRWTLEQSNDIAAMFIDRNGVPQTSLPPPEIPIGVCPRDIVDSSIPGPPGKGDFTAAEDPIAGCPYESDVGGTLPVYQSSGSVLAGSMMDIDGDGLMDLVRSYAHEEEGFSWWRNLGNGFSSAEMCDDSACDGPRRGLHVSFSFSQTITDDAGSSTGSARGDALVVRDINSDGALDEVDVFEGTVSYGVYRPAGLMTAVTNGHGVVSEVVYGPASDQGTSGEPGLIDERQNNVGADLVVGIDTFSHVTGSEVSTDYHYAGRDCPFGQCLGFEERTVSTTAPDHLGLISGAFNLGWAFERTLVEETYDLYRDGALKTSAITHTDHDLGWIADVGDVSTNMLARFEQTWEYADLHLAPLEMFPPSGPLPRVRLTGRTVTEHGEQSGSREVAYTYGYHPLAGTLLGVTEDADGLLRLTDISWELSTDGRQWLPVQKDTRGAGNVVVERLLWTYDGLGRMDSQSVCTAEDLSQGTGCTASIDWSFGRHDRGMVDLVDGPLGSDLRVDSFLYGGTVAGVTVDGVGMYESREVDDHGRVNVAQAKSTAISGVQTTTHFDDLGRPVAEYVLGEGGTAWELAKEYIYDNWSIPGALLPDGTEMTVPVTQTFTYDGGSDDEDDDEVPGPYLSNVVEVSDGAGNTRQTYRRNLDDTGWIVSDALHDLFGSERATTHPHTVSALPMDLSEVLANTGAVLSWTEVDALGTPRVSFPDQSNHPNCRTVGFAPEPGVAHTVDTTGLHKRMTHDGLGRLVKVEEGRPSDELAADCPAPPSTAVASAAPHTTGEYTYDAADRLKSFTYEADGVPVTVAYTYDLAGRQTEVHRTVTGEDPLHWRTFEFDGGYPVRMYEGTSTGEPLATASSTANGCVVTLDANYAPENDNLAVAWTWDELGRVTQKWVRNPDGGYDCYDVSWDTGFPGARTRSTDPTGYTEWLYADLVGDAGNLGLPSTATRTWTDTGGDPRTASFDYDYDLAGNVIVKMFPSGVQVDTTRSNGWVTTEQVTLADDQVYINLYPSWDERGYATGYEVYDPQPQLRGVLSIQRTSPTQVDRTTWMAMDSYTVDYDWMGAGALLTGKTFSEKLATAVDADSVSYAYDELNRVVEVDLNGQNASLDPEETYTYDPMGHLLQAQLSPVNATTTVWETTWGEQQLGSITWGAQRFGPRLGPPAPRWSGSTTMRWAGWSTPSATQPSPPTATRAPVSWSGSTMARRTCTSPTTSTTTWSGGRTPPAPESTGSTPTRSTTTTAPSAWWSPSSRRCRSSTGWSPSGSVGSSTVMGSSPWTGTGCFRGPRSWERTGCRLLSCRGMTVWT